MPCVNMSVVAFWRRGAQRALVEGGTARRRRGRRSLTMAGYSHTGQWSAKSGTRAGCACVAAVGGVFDDELGAGVGGGGEEVAEAVDDVVGALASSAAWPGGGAKQSRACWRRVAH